MNILALFYSYGTPPPPPSPAGERQAMIAASPLPVFLIMPDFGTKQVQVGTTFVIEN